MSALIRSAKLAKETHRLIRSRQDGAGAVTRDHAESAHVHAVPSIPAADRPAREALETSRSYGAVNFGSTEGGIAGSIEEPLGVAEERAAPLSIAADPPSELVAAADLEAQKERMAEELAALREQVRREGYESGERQGREAAEAEYADLLPRMKQIMESMQRALDEGIEGTADIGAEIVYEAVAKILGKSMVEQDGVVAVVREVIRQAKDRNRIVVRVAQADVDLLNGKRNEIIEGLNVNHVEIVPDDHVEVGGCLIETPTGNLDGRLEIQMQRLRDALLSVRPKWKETRPE